MSVRKLLLFPELHDHGVPFGRRYIDRLGAEGNFPRRVPIGAKRVGWIATEIEGWVSAAIALRSRNVAAQALAERVD
ncbi:MULTISPECIES: AlpA family phage regulatory protein [unclassified Bradyrhizobium]|uniref:helix-turn-helix transcriptional regulator n=1 Tax=unclassified Bradyrhizobium TaxID=2631580 RepID=UPI001FF8A7D7|nr:MULTISPECIES: AlpA family phage regulatory protein [unclassified Bradyrhizobium]MCK1710283.1 AlpA family phage regulatory protein [Bradyrhizobium sp. 143]MCK1726630.1 AlpA family phage regulatory protein [Bradyrhizobium sp. 142]